MFDFKIITDIAAIRSQIEPLLEQHYAELTLDKDVIRLDPDWEQYQQLHNEGKLFALGAYYYDRLVGYSVFFLRNHIHYRDAIIANNDVLFLAPEFRVGRLGIELIRRSEQHLQELGVAKITWHVKTSRDFRVLLTRLGYVEEDIIMGRALRKET